MSWRMLAAMVCAAATYAVLQTAAGFLMPEPRSVAGQPPDLTLSTLVIAAIMFIAIALGAWIARGRFMVAALVLWAVPMGLLWWVAYRITLAAKPIGVLAYSLEFAAANTLLLASTLGAVLAGVAVGRVLARRSALSSEGA